MANNRSMLKKLLIGLIFFWRLLDMIPNALTLYLTPSAQCLHSQEINLHRRLKISCVTHSPRGRLMHHHPKKCFPVRSD